MKCKVCKKAIKQKRGPGRPRTKHARCSSSKKTLKRKGKKKSIKKRGSVRRYQSGAVTKSQRGRHLAGVGTGWRVLWHFGRTGDTQHDKTWAVRIARKGSGWTVLTRHGKRYGQKNETSRKTMSKAEAIALGNKLLKQKFRKGYAYLGSKHGR
ncbi:hypothetical protein C4588_03625 [Candidatus Parcubacteria bacterium]|nr:MAG: hypothetical protein C4588_03625 [Candidatus Parcubacteria bacterium]